LAHRAAPAIDPSTENICFMPGGASPFELWGIDNFLALAARIRADRPGARFVFVLGRDERFLGALAQAVRASRVTIANDCGPAHVAQLLGGPYVGLFANHPGQAERIAAQWFLPRPGARWVSGPAHASISDLLPGRV
jgi:ADP-heptose:LPS heptosyltransferase